MKRVFVRGLSRSGGTLMVTILDAHPDLAMGYELYEHLLEPLANFTPSRGFWRIFRRDSANPNRTVPLFAGRAARSDIDADTFDRIYEQHKLEGGNFGDFSDRMQFVERIVCHKMVQQGKQHWGTKIGAKYEQILDTFVAGDCYFLFMQRDGRDVAASQKLVGNFNKTPTAVARSWRNQVERFRSFAASPAVHARCVRYESLALEPEKTIRGIVEFLGIPWSDNLLTFYRQDLSLFRAPHGHLSAQQVNKPINAGSIGRWKQDLTPEEVKEVEAEAGDLLRELGYAA